MAAEAIAQELRNQGHVAELFDFKDIIGAFTNRITKEFHNFATTHIPLLHRGIAAATDSPTILDAIIALSPGKVAENIEMHIRASRPDIIVSTYPAANRLITGLKGEYHFSLVSIITDLASLHAYWTAPGTDAYIAPLPETAAALQKLGVPASHIHTLGYPLRDAFFENKNRDALRHKLGATRDAFVVLYMAHSAPDPFVADLARMLHKTPDITPVVICGKNETLRKKLSRTLRKRHIVGFVNNVDEYLQIADVIIGKAGPGFLMEAAAIGRPVIITKYLKPQEEGNVEIFTAHNFGFVETTAEDALRRVLLLKNEPVAAREERSRAMRALVPHNATKAIVKFVIDMH